ncbi:Thaumatin-like protein [Actinidia chinensis var. chinensis]|uniref:Thaumatin-like protein n=1 Tax=Actinidia chinensis var. chinensis TaxID=1590841 RepID=A0A2R6QKS5_ACTCC|nr:Thaumatin-like protein [Actinidia chinensis var. chinensis]
MALLNLSLLFFFFFYFIGADGAVFTLQNRCNSTIWLGIQAGAGTPQLMNGGLELNPGQPINVNAPTGWSGRFWGRTGCFFDQSGKGYCATGNCGGGVAECAGAGGEPPATLAEFTLNSPLDFYDISLVDGFNIPVSIVPTGGSGDCKSAQCLSDLNQNCPHGLQVRRNGRVVACKSACLAFNQPEYCCTGAYNNPNTCKPSNYSRVFKDSCPAAYSYAYDDSSSIFTCKGANYLITFC